jgi:hypothetical protein
MVGGGWCGGVRGERQVKNSLVGAEVKNPSVSARPRLHDDIPARHHETPRLANQKVRSATTMNPSSPRSIHYSTRLYTDTPPVIPSLVKITRSRDTPRSHHHTTPVDILQKSSHASSHTPNNFASPTTPLKTCLGTTHQTLSARPHSSLRSRRLASIVPHSPFPRTHPLNRINDAVKRQQHREAHVLKHVARRLLNLPPPTGQHTLGRIPPTSETPPTEHNTTERAP